MGKRKEEKEGQDAAAWASVPSDLLPEILSRMPYPSLCRFKCVSTVWLALCSDPAVRRRSPQKLSGFFRDSFRDDDGSGHRRSGLDFLNLSGRGRPLVDPSLRFLCQYEHVNLVHCCGGILLCTGWDRTKKRSVFVVCNPATEDIWAVSPFSDMHGPGYPLIYGNYIICLCFNPAVPGRFAVFLFVRHASRATIKSVQVYSSDTGEWTSMESGWGLQIVLRGVEFGYVFLNGTLHFTAFDHDNSEGNRSYGTLLIVTVDMEGNTWSTIPMPAIVDSYSYIIGQSEGRLCCVQKDNGNDRRLSVWVLEDYASGQWTLKHTASVLELPSESYRLVAIHPECNVIFLQDWVEAWVFMSYDMDNKKLHVICTPDEYDVLPFWPYIPCFAERLAVAQ